MLFQGIGPNYAAMMGQRQAGQAPDWTAEATGQGGNQHWWGTRNGAPPAQLQLTQLQQEEQLQQAAETEPAGVGRARGAQSTASVFQDQMQEVYIQVSASYKSETSKSLGF